MTKGLENGRSLEGEPESSLPQELTEAVITGVTVVT